MICFQWKDIWGLGFSSAIFAYFSLKFCSPGACFAIALPPRKSCFSNGSIQLGCTSRVSQKCPIIFLPCSHNIMSDIGPSYYSIGFTSCLTKQRTGAFSSWTLLPREVVDRKSRPLYTFWKRESSAWVEPKLATGGKWWRRFMSTVDFHPADEISEYPETPNGKHMRDRQNH